MIIEILKWVAPMGTIAAVGWMLNDRFSALSSRITTIEIKMDLLLKGQLSIKYDTQESISGEHPTMTPECVCSNYCPLGRGTPTRD